MKINFGEHISKKYYMQVVQSTAISAKLSIPYRAPSISGISTAVLKGQQQAAICCDDYPLKI